jgi:hypothetical protein
MSAQFTPGPWDCVERTVFALDETGTVNRFSASVQTGFVRRQQGWDAAERTSTDELTANAHLIAAAPDLYEALELADAALRGAHMNMGVIEKKVATALAKARGEA